MLAAFEHGFEPGAQRERGLARAGPAAERDDPDVLIEQQVERDPLLGAAAAQAEHVTIAANQAHGLVGQHPPERAARARAAAVEHEAGVAGQVAGGGEVERAGLVQLVDLGRVVTSSSRMPVQPDSGGSSARYSWAARPIEAALIRSGRSLLTRTTSAPSAARLRATDKILVSLSPSLNPAGRTDGSVWFSSTLTVPPSSPTSMSASSRPCSIRRSSRWRSAARAK